jgi:transcriptional regulator with XRE-family HTH domain
MMMVLPRQLEDPFRRRLSRLRTRPFPALADIPEQARLCWIESVCENVFPGVRTYDVGVVLHSTFASEWPVTVHIPSALAGFRHSLDLSQVKFAAALGIKRLNIERWESGKARPFRGNIHPLLTSVRSLVDSPTVAGQFLNLVAAAILPNLTRPAGTYRRGEITAMLVDAEGNHGDLAETVLDLLITSELLVPFDPGDSSESAIFLPRIGVQTLDRHLEPWGPDVLAAAAKLSVDDRKLWLDLADRLAGNRIDRSAAPGR